MHSGFPKPVLSRNPYYVSSTTVTYQCQCTRQGFNVITTSICNHLEPTSSLAKYMPCLACVCVCIRSGAGLVLHCCAACGPQINALNETLLLWMPPLCLLTRPGWDRVEGFEGGGGVSPPVQRGRGGGLPIMSEKLKGGHGTVTKGLQLESLCFWCGFFIFFP